MKQISIEPLQAAELPEATVVASRAFSSNPLTMAIVREQRDKERRQETIFRALLGTNPPGSLLTVSVIIVVTLLISGAFYFRRMEKTFADVI